MSEAIEIHLHTQFWHQLELMIPCGVHIVGNLLHTLQQNSSPLDSFPRHNLPASIWSHQLLCKEVISVLIPTWLHTCEMAKLRRSAGVKNFPLQYKVVIWEATM